MNYSQKIRTYYTASGAFKLPDTVADCSGRFLWCDKDGLLELCRIYLHMDRPWRFRTCHNIKRHWLYFP